MSDVPSEMVRQMILEVGDAGIAEMATAPGLAAAVDQHAAAVRDVISVSGNPVTRAVVLDYLHGFTDAAIERGWWPTGAFDWETVRVTAACSIIRDLGAG